MTTLHGRARSAVPACPILEDASQIICQMLPWYVATTAASAILPITCMQKVQLSFHPAHTHTNLAPGVIDHVAVSTQRLRHGSSDSCSHGTNYMIAVEGPGGAGERPNPNCRWPNPYRAHTDMEGAGTR
jgi:hypothetical protein